MNSKVRRGSAGCGGVQWSAARLIQCGVVQRNAAELSKERRGSVECGEIQWNAAQLSGMRSSSFGAGGLLGQCSVHSRVRHGSVGND
jgi:hypothetical protein